MLPFFRKIRYRLAERNQFFKYSRYAIGEIVLVVIGILIALSVNNYNQSRINKKDEAAYLEGIRADLLKQIIDFKEFISYNGQRIAIINELLDNEVKQGGFKRNDSVISMFNKIISVSAPTEIKTTFTELLFSGDLKLIRNESLKNDIVRFYQDLEEMVQRSNSNITNVYQNHLLQILTSRTIVGYESNYADHSGNLKDEIHNRNYPDHVKEATFEKLEDPNLELELINALNLRAVIEALQKDRSDIIIESAQELIERIESELRNQHNIEF
jgi:hypothetical protein